MSYTPPGVTTVVNIANNIVQLPGGTRVLALIGLGQKTLSTTNESVTQTASRISLPLVHSANGVTSIQSIYDFTGPGGAQIIYSPVGSGPFGEGYYITPTGATATGTSIAWAPSANAYPTSTTPAVGSLFNVTYSGTFNVTGTQVDTVTVTGVANYDNILPGTGTLTALSILSVSGNGQTYNTSGTNSGVDSLGYSIMDTGYVLSPSGTLLWGAVPTGSYGYSYATTPLTGNIFYTNYTYNKSGTDYNPQSFVDQNLVVQTYGPEANWIPVTGNQGNISYQVGSLNPVTLASRLAFDNGSSIVNITQISGNGLSAGDFHNPLNLLQGQTVDIVVPLTVGSGASLTEVSTANKIQMIQAVQQHVDTMSLPQNALERVAVASIGVADIGNANTANTYVQTAEETFFDKRVTIIAPGACTVQIQDPSGAFQNVTVDSAFMSAAYAGLSCSPLSDVATPLTRQQLADFVGLNAQSPNHPMTSYLTIEKNILGGAGVCVIDTLGAQIFVRQQLTTNQSNPAVGEFSVVTSTDYVSQAVRYTCNQFIGKKLIPAIVVPAVKSTILATMNALVQDQLISAPGAITVVVSPTDPTTLLATVQYVPVFPLNHIQVTFVISTQL